jgi:hypothetical protein
MNDLLDAECVITLLCSKKIIVMADWKKPHPNDQDYSVYFDKLNAVSDISIQFVKRSDRYYIPRSLVSVLSFRHSFDAKDIYTTCAISA